MPFNFCPKRDASFWENGSELKRFVLELQTGGFADYTSKRERNRYFFIYYSLTIWWICIDSFPIVVISKEEKSSNMVLFNLM